MYCCSVFSVIHCRHSSASLDCVSGRARAQVVAAAHQAGYKVVHTGETDSLKAFCSKQPEVCKE